MQVYRQIRQAEIANMNGQTHRQKQTDRYKTGWDWKRADRQKQTKPDTDRHIHH